MTPELRVRGEPIPRPRGPRVTLGVGLLLLVGAIAVARVPFGATMHRSGRAESFDCSSPGTAVAKRDPGEKLRALFEQVPPRPHDTVPIAPPSPEARRAVDRVVAAVDRYHACHRPASIRMLVAVVAGVVGLGLLGRRRYRWLQVRGDDGSTREPGSARAFGYHAALDGLRAVSILLVMGRHAGFKGVFLSGDQGVDIFFVLSGFLITTLLLREHGRAGEINLGYFYVRRVLRLYPVVLLALVIGAAVHLFWPGLVGAPTWGGLAAMTFYYANWMHGWDAAAMGFFAHTWSLSIEEQFYLLWPPVVLVFLARRRGYTTLAVIAGAGAVIAATYRAWSWLQALQWSTGVTDARLRRLAVAAHAASAHDHWYFNFFTRADSLLVGCLLAILLTPGVLAKLRGHPQRVTRVAWVAAAVAAYVLLQGSVIGNADFFPVWGLPVFEVSVAVVVLGLVTIETSRMASLLSARVLTWIGRRSYGLYVLHVPVSVLVWDTHLVSGYWPKVVLTNAASFVAAALSFRFVETPALALKRRFGGASAPVAASVKSS